MKKPILLSIVVVILLISLASVGLFFIFDTDQEQEQNQEELSTDTDEDPQPSISNAFTLSFQDEIEVVMTASGEGDVQDTFWGIEIKDADEDDVLNEIKELAPGEFLYKTTNLFEDVEYIEIRDTGWREISLVNQQYTSISLGSSETRYYYNFRCPWGDSEEISSNEVTISRQACELEYSSFDTPDEVNSIDTNICYLDLDEELLLAYIDYSLEPADPCEDLINMDLIDVELKNYSESE